MKSIVCILSVSFVITMGSCSQDFTKLEGSQVDKSKLQFAEKFANDYLTKLREGSYYEFKDEAIDIIKNQQTEETQKAVYSQLKEQFGDYKGLEYVETWVKSSDNSLTIFRFKGEFEKSNKKLEIRVVLDASGKIAGFWITPWSDMINL